MTGYQYRGCPCTIATHSVDGHDTTDNSSGVLEWCYSLEDAWDILDLMLKDVGRFKHLRISEYSFRERDK